MFEKLDISASIFKSQEPLLKNPTQALMYPALMSGGLTNLMIKLRWNDTRFPACCSVARV